MAVRSASEEEKRKIADNIEVEIENVPEEQNPVDVVLTQVQTYHDNMVKQINTIKTMIDVNGKIIKAIEALYEACENEEKKQVYKEELGAREDIVVKSKQSLAIMQERIGITAKIKDMVKNNLNDMKLLDFYFGNQLGLVTSEDLDKILDKYTK